MLLASPAVQASLILAGYSAFTFWCYRKPLLTYWQKVKKPKANTIIAYASESGSAAQLSYELEAKFNAQSNHCICLSLNELARYPLTNIDTLLLVVSTYGEGEAPDNGRYFIDHLTSQQPNLAHLKHAILALGDSDYKQFCQFGLDVNDALSHANSQKIFEPVLVDKLAPEAISSWYEKLSDKNILKRNKLEDRVRVQPDLHPKKHTHALTLTSRQQVNVGSPGAPLFEINLTVPSELKWQAGDIAQLHIDNKVREYSIASVPEENQLTLLVREQKHPNGKLGLGSGHLCHHTAIDSANNISVRSNPKFHPIDDANKLILIGNGSGLAGLRAHLKHREIKQQKQNWLIYGERCASNDLPWHDQLTAWSKTDHLAQLDFAFSRQTLDSRVEVGQSHTGYVQDALLAQSEQLKTWITEGAAILICGSLQGMAKGVEDTLIQILGSSALEQLSEEGRYRRDVY